MSFPNVVAANDPGAVKAVGWIIVAWAVVVGTFYVTRVFIPGWRKEGLRECWKHAAVVLTIVALVGSLGALFLTVFVPSH